MSASRLLVSNAAVSVVQTLISGLLLFLLYRYLIDQLGSEKLGLWSVILAGTSVAKLSELGLAGSVVKFVAQARARDDDKQVSAVIQTSAVSVAIAMALLTLAIYPLLGIILRASIPESAIANAFLILPWAVLSLWIGSIAGVFQSALDGCHCIAVRNVILIVANLLYFLAAFWLVPMHGLIGLAVGQVVQGLLLVVLTWYFLKREVPALPWFPFQWSKKVFKEIFSYATNFQINSIAIMLFEPATKLMISKYGGLSSAAYYEMASQFIVKLRGLLVSASQALVPTVAGLHEKSPSDVSALYLKTYRLIFLLCIPFFGALIVALPAVSTMWIGREESQFIQFGVLLTIGWGFNSLSIPAYFFNLGTGNLTWNSVAHVLMAVLNTLLGVILGMNFGAQGVAFGVMVTLLLGSGFLIVNIKSTNKLDVCALIPAESINILIFTATFAVLFYWFSSYFYLFNSAVATGGIALLIYFVLFSGMAWFHPYKNLIMSRRKILVGG